MKKIVTILAATSALAFAGSVTAGGCNYNKSAVHTGPANMVAQGDYQGSFIKTGAYSSMKADKPDIVDTAISAGSFNTLVKAVQAAGLVDTLKSDGPFTVFAPTDQAFAKLPAGTLDSLLADKNKLAQVLKYHVVPGKLDAQAVTNMSKLATAQGSELPVSSISIASTDIVTSNGIIHVIDEVLIPQS